MSPVEFYLSVKMDADAFDQFSTACERQGKTTEEVLAELAAEYAQLHAPHSVKE